MKNQFPKMFVVQNDTIVVEENLHHTLNTLAARFYRLHGYAPEPGFDFLQSNHPQERLMYMMALEAAYMQIQTGELDS